MASRDGFRSIVAAFAAISVLAFLAVFFLSYGATGFFRWELLLHGALIGFVVWMVIRAPTPRPDGRCPVCSSRVFPTRRTSDGARLWTCSGCAFEIPRTWRRPPSSAMGPPRPENPGITP